MILILNLIELQNAGYTQRENKHMIDYKKKHMIGSYCGA